MDKKWHIIIHYYLAIQINENHDFAGKWMELEVIIFTGISHIQECFLSITEPILKIKDMTVEWGLFGKMKATDVRGDEYD